MKEKQIIVVIILLAVSLITYLWLRNNNKAVRQRGTTKYRGPNAGSRASDLKILSPQEEKIRERAKRLISKGQIRQAAQMLEQIGLHRDAITALEKAKLIDEAARVLLRMQNPTRAGVVYSRNGHWKEAAQCFIQAGNLGDAATCLREAGNHFEAADLFLKENQLENAAECFEKAGRWLEAARSWSKAEKQDKALRCWREIGSNPSLLKGQIPTSDEMETLFTLAKSGDQNPGIITLIVGSPKVNQMILTALSGGHRVLADSIIKAAPPHIIPTLISEVNLQSPDAKSLAEVLNERGEYRFAAMLYEQLSLFELAAACFQKSGEAERAKYCLERLGGSASRRGNLEAASPTTPPVTPNSGQQVVGGNSLKGNFFIETGSFAVKNADTSAPEQAPNAESPALKVTPPPALQAILSNSSDETAVIKSSWLFAQILESELDSIAKSFKIINVSKDSVIQSGSPSSFLIFVVRGELHSDQGARAAGHWLAPDLAMSNSPSVTWTAATSSRVLVMTASDFDQTIGSNAGIMRKVFINLTRQRTELQDNQLISKAI